MTGLLVGVVVVVAITVEVCGLGPAGDLWRRMVDKRLTNELLCLKLFFVTGIVVVMAQDK